MPSAQGHAGSPGVAKTRRSRYRRHGRSLVSPADACPQPRMNPAVKRELINALITTPTRLLGLRRSLKTTSKASRIRTNHRSSCKGRTTDLLKRHPRRDKRQSSRAKGPAYRLKRVPVFQSWKMRSAWTPSGNPKRHVLSRMSRASPSTLTSANPRANASSGSSDSNCSAARVNVSVP